MNEARTRRRQFLGKMAGITAGVIGFPDLITPSALGKAGGVAPSNRVTLGFIGLGWMGGGHLLEPFLRLSGTHVLAVCDVDGRKRERAKALVENFYKNQQPNGTYKGCDTHNDFR